MEVERSPHIPHHVTRGTFNFVHPYIQLHIGVKLLGCMKYANQEALRPKTNDNERPFICPIQPRLSVGMSYTLHNFLIHGHYLNSMGGHEWAWMDMSGHGWTHIMLWVGMGGHRSMMMVMIWVWVQI